MTGNIQIASLNQSGILSVLHKNSFIALISRASNIAFLLEWAQISDLDFGLIQQNISTKKASFQYQGCPLSFKSGKLWLNSYIFKIRIHCYKDNSNNINVWLETLRVGVKNKLYSNSMYSIGPWISTPYVGVKAAKDIVILSQHMELDS